ncbi:WbqC family protein [Aquirufa sp. ROCK-SH2]
MHIELHYLPSLEYMSLLYSSDSIEFEVEENFIKQSFRNRTLILGANGVESLTVPIIHLSGKKQQMKDVQIDYSQDWIRRHKGGINAAYGKAPYFEHFEPLISSIFAKKNKFLVDLNIDFLKLIERISGRKLNYSFTETFIESKSESFYNHLSPKIAWKERAYYVECPYRQVFGTEFVPNLSVVDLFMNYGREMNDILDQSFRKLNN